MWGGAANSRVCPKKPKYVAGSRRFGRGGQAGRTPRERAASPKTVNQSVSAPCVRHICAICRRRPRFASREALSMWRDGWRFTFVSPSGKKQMCAKNANRTQETRKWEPDAARYYKPFYWPTRPTQKAPFCPCACRLNSSAPHASLTLSRLRPSVYEAGLGEIRRIPKDEEGEPYRSAL